MKDYTTNNANPALPQQWNDCTTCGAGITRKTDPTQQCRSCHEAQVMQEFKKSFMDVWQIDELNGKTRGSSGTWGYGDADCELTGGMG